MCVCVGDQQMSFSAPSTCRCVTVNLHWWAALKRPDSLWFESANTIFATSFDAAAMPPAIFKEFGVRTCKSYMLSRTSAETLLKLADELSGDSDAEARSARVMEEMKEADMSKTSWAPIHPRISAHSKRLLVILLFFLHRLSMVMWRCLRNLLILLSCADAAHVAFVGCIFWIFFGFGGEYLRTLRKSS